MSEDSQAPQIAPLLAGHTYRRVVTMTWPTDSTNDVIYEHGAWVDVTEEAAEAEAVSRRFLEDNAFMIWRGEA